MILKTLVSTRLAPEHISAAGAMCRNANTMVVQAEQQIQDAIIILKEIMKDMQPGDPNIETFNKLIGNLS